MRSSSCLLLVAAAVAFAAACDSSSSSGTAPTADGGVVDFDAGNTTADGGTNPTAEVTPDDLAKGGSCPAPTGTGTEHHGIISADETWTAAGSPHILTFGVDVRATITIEPCAVVHMGTYSITVGSNTDIGKLVAHGTAEVKDGQLDVRPVTFDSADAAVHWGQISAEPKGTIDFSVVAIKNGGDVGSGQPGALLARGIAGGTNDGEPLLNMTLDRVLVESSASFGLNLEAWGGLTAASKKVWIRKSTDSAVRLEPGVAKTLPADMVLTGNTKDEILLTTSKTFMRDDRFGDHGVPYHAKGAIWVAPPQDGAGPTLTIDPGVTVAFEDNAGSGVEIGDSDVRPGALVAVGTAAKPITFTSAKATKAAGDWRGLVFTQAAPATHVSYAKIEYAGAASGTTGFGCGPSDNSGAVFIAGIGGNDIAPSVFIDNTAFDHIGGTTVIVSGWIDDAGPNFAPTNTFAADTPSCKVSKPRRTGAGDVCDGGRTTCWP